MNVAVVIIASLLIGSHSLESHNSTWISSDTNSVEHRDPATGDDIDVREGGSHWASIQEDGTVRIGGRSVGRIQDNGTVRRGGSSIGEVESDGTIRRGGSSIGEIESDGTIRMGGSSVGRITSSGSIRIGGSSWGSASNCNDFDEFKKVAALLVFFSDALE